MGWPLLGNMLPFFKNFSSGHPDIFIDNLVLKYGETGIYKSHLFGNPSIIVTESEICKRVLLDDVNFKSSYPKSTQEVIPCRLLTSPVEHRRFKRLITAPIIGHNILVNYLECIEDIVTNSLEELSSMKKPIELLKEMKKITFEIIYHIFMGSYDKGNVTKFGDLFEDVFHGLFSIPVNVPGFGLNKAFKARKKLIEIVQAILVERRLMVKNGQIGEKKYLIDILFEIKDDENGDKLKDEDIIDLLIGLLASGHETTALAMMWSIIYLTQHPHCLKKAKEEQEEIMKVRPSFQKHLNFKEIKQMVYLSQVIDEVLRHANLSFSIFREATSDQNINGYFVPKGWKVLVWPRAIHMNSKYYSNPKEFDPSRWDDRNSTAKPFIPFGAGKRLCPGYDLARLEISIFLHYFLLNYKLERINPKCHVTNFHAPMPVDNCLAKVIKLSNA